MSTHGHWTGLEDYIAGKELAGIAPGVFNRLTADESNEALWHRLECCLLFDILVELQAIHEALPYGGPPEEV